MLVPNLIVINYLKPTSRTNALTDWISASGGADFFERSFPIAYGNDDPFSSRRVPPMQTPFLSTADSCRSFIIFDTPSIDDT
jgi:hypothetical protein